ncbi:MULTISPECIES: xanthine dehydrogenase family protein molybdopterin-binding subunit [unclassified Duganella]|uniref:xanthine dehydrogenase family protein molybdopterin-binding subunit n=1 Tax=unclassified Duganella TaxID=2636909 RepID=UPI000880E91F|nr:MULTISPECIES: xanthine dehydrogenase family protein molybdopterin-binding subunit [unclassified Duganella]SDH23408.1 isoquinoline 1-oxidoreductase, beta subunit [Duganella sp. OV458]SDK45113.1 isoquinoline 1-oxidoreductase, beta subunit [Duganella sp. OV510]
MNTPYAPGTVSRRSFLKVAAAAGGSLMVGFWPVEGEAAAATAADLNAFIAIGADDSIVLTMPKVEMGQGTYTSIPMLIAEELEVDLDKIQLRHAPPNAKVYGAPFGDQFTGGSLTIRLMYEPMRQTGAAARMVLVQAAANEWKVPADSCRAEHGEVVHAASGRRVKYGKLVAAASQIAVPEKIALKDPKDFKLVGKPAKRLDAKGKTDGSAMFGIDAQAKGLKVAVVAASPVIGGKLKSVNDAKARKLRGVRQVVKLDNAVAVVADNYWYAKQGLAALDIVWDEGKYARLTTDDVRNTMVAALKKPGHIARNDGDASKALAADGKRVEALYINPMLAHATMEPMNCTVHVKGDGTAEIWTGSQVPARARDDAAKVLGLAPEKVTLHNHYIGGGFGRRLYTDYVTQAAAVAKQVKGPVKLVWSREEDIQHCLFRGLYAHSVSASLDAQGKPVAFSHKIAGPSNLAAFAPGWLKDGLDIDNVEGSDIFSYDIPNMRSEYTQEDGPVPTAFWRGVGPTRNMTVLESFMDELALKAGQDPLAYRLSLLSKQPRAAEVLKVAAQKAGWGEKLPARSGRGIALMRAWGTYLAQVVDVTVSDDGEVAVKRVVCAVDCGQVVNPDTVVAQIQSGINYGLTAGLFGVITLKDGRVEQSNFHDYPILRMSQAPKIDVVLVQSSEAPGGIGEPGTAGVGAALTNAVFAATGVRVREMPLRAELLKKV